MRNSLAQARAAHRSYQNQQAIAFAEIGLEIALHEFNFVEDDSRWDGWEGNLASGYIKSDMVTNADGEVMGEYEVVIYDADTRNPVIDTIAYVPERGESADPTIMVLAGEASGDEHAARLA